VADTHDDLSADEAREYVIETHGRERSVSTLRRYARAGILTARVNEQGEYRFSVDALDVLYGRTHYAAAARRVRNTPELDAYRDTILADRNEGSDHWQWIASAPVAQIVDWAREQRTTS
jgi:hypothetical protein